MRRLPTGRRPASPAEKLSDALPIYLLLVVGLFLVHELHSKVVIEDCLMAGRLHCDWLVERHA